MDAGRFPESATGDSRVHPLALLGGSTSPNSLPRHSQKRSPKNSGRKPAGMGAFSMFFPVVIGFSAGCMLWTLMRIIPSLPLSAARQKVTVIDPRVPETRPTGRQSIDPFEAETRQVKSVPPPSPVVMVQAPRVIPPLPPGKQDEPFRGKIGEGLQGGGPNWRYKLPKELSDKIKSQKDLPKFVIRLARNVIQEASTGRKWERIGRDWIELEEAAEEHERLAELESQRTESKALTASLKQLEEKETAAKQRDVEKLKLIEKERKVKDQEEKARLRKEREERNRERESQMKAEKEKAVIKKTRALSRGSKLRELCLTAVRGGALAKTCDNW
eukprot:CAMPEP_0118944836 /NCGR_PEP_ID=MMETSP1169-20130426/41106_1 /TAXON_ID=36882 /ORGANISM="Pyramimonas obovata, Strain CCMP722" /LENGTH=329 /DNA_ID=CAMNT_0006890409 /DNA_START=99 /DNA_END=1085 /DNA_ORIENTATION=-